MHGHHVQKMLNFVSFKVILKALAAKAGEPARIVC